MQVDEPRRDDETPRVDRAGGARGIERRARDEDDAIVLDGDVGGIAGRAGAVDNGAVADQQRPLGLLRGQGERREAGDERGDQGPGMHLIPP